MDMNDERYEDIAIIEQVEYNPYLDEIESLYESYANGEITIEEREEQILDVRYKSFFESLLEVSEYGLATEGVSKMLDDLIKKSKMKKHWKNNDGYRKSVKKSKIKDKEYSELQEDFKIIKTTKFDDIKQYPKYKSAFDRVCKFFGIPGSKSGTVLIQWFNKKGDKKDDNSSEIHYCNAHKKIRLPENYMLFHKTPVDINELKPTFKSKNGNSWFYGTPRVYFTIHKKMSNLAANLKPGQKVNIYTPNQKITDLNLDPGLLGFSNGAIYVDTNRPIKVRPIEKRDFIDSDFINVKLNRESVDDLIDCELTTESLSSMKAKVDLEKYYMSKAREMVYECNKAIKQKRFEDAIEEIDNLENLLKDVIKDMGEYNTKTMSKRRYLFFGNFFGIITKLEDFEKRETSFDLDKSISVKTEKPLVKQLRNRIMALKKKVEDEQDGIKYKKRLEELKKESTECLTPFEKVENISNVLYTLESKSEISLDTREDLINLAKKVYLK